MNRVRTIMRLVARMVIGIVIGITVVIFYFSIDYLETSDKRLYFIDNKDAFITVLTMGILIGVITGIVWAVSNNDPNK